MNARIPALLLALAVVALPAPSHAQGSDLPSCTKGNVAQLQRAESRYSYAQLKLTENDHQRYKTLLAAVRPSGSTLAQCMARRNDLVALDAALKEMINAPQPGHRLRGGLIVDVTEAGKHGLVAFPDDQPGMLRTSGVRVAGMTHDLALKSCNDLVGGGFSDWYLPSYDELLRVWKQRAAIGGFRDQAVYWTSTWYAGNHTTIDWNGGKWGYRGDFGEIGTQPSVRCVRKF